MNYQLTNILLIEDPRTSNNSIFFYKKQLYILHLKLSTIFCQFNEKEKEKYYLFINKQIQLHIFI